MEQRVRKNLQGDGRFEVGILREPDHAHAAAADDFLQSIAAKNSLAHAESRDLYRFGQIQIIWQSVALHRILVVCRVNNFNRFL